MKQQTVPKQKKKTKRYIFKESAQYFGLKTSLLQGLKEKWKIIKLKVFFCFLPLCP